MIFVTFQSMRKWIKSSVSHIWKLPNSKFKLAALVAVRNLGGDSIALKTRLSFLLKNRLRVPFSEGICINCKNAVTKIRLKNRMTAPQAETQAVF